MSEKRDIAVGKDGVEMRLDRWIRQVDTDYSQALIQKFLRKGTIRVGGKKMEASYRLKKGDIVTLPAVKGRETQKKARIQKPVSHDEIEWIRERVIYRDQDILMLDKPAGLATQGGTGVARSVDDLLEYLLFGAEEKPKLVHRIDKDTSGILVLARSPEAARELGRLFKGREVEKTYLAVTAGVPHPLTGTINAPLLPKKATGGLERTAVDEEGKPAITEYRVIDRAHTTAALVELSPRTGRMHQLRAHMVHVGCPILGDGKYGGRNAFIQGLGNRLHLHAWRIRVPYKRKMIEVEAPLPAHMKETLALLGLS